MCVMNSSMHVYSCVLSSLTFTLLMHVLTIQAHFEATVWHTHTHFKQTKFLSLSIVLNYSRTKNERATEREQQNPISAQAYRFPPESKLQAWMRKTEIV